MQNLAGKEEDKRTEKLRIGSALRQGKVKISTQRLHHVIVSRQSLHSMTSCPLLSKLRLYCSQTSNLWNRRMFHEVDDIILKDYHSETG